MTVTVRPSQTVEERVADEFKEKELRKAAEDKLAADRSARITAKSPKALLSRARTFYVHSGTSFFDPAQLHDALRKRDEFALWEMTILDGRDKYEVADMSIEIDRPLFTYTFPTRSPTARTGMILATGKVTAFDSHAAAPQLAKESSRTSGRRARRRRRKSNERGKAKGRR